MSFTHISARADNKTFARYINQKRYKCTPKAREALVGKSNLINELYGFYKLTGDVKYRNQILEISMPKVIYCVKQMARPNEDADDLIQEASIQFLLGIDNYDESKADKGNGKIAIDNYAMAYCKKAVFNFRETHSHNIRIPAQVHRAAAQVGKRTQEAAKEWDSEHIPIEVLFPDKHNFIKEGIAVMRSRYNVVDTADADIEDQTDMDNLDERKALAIISHFSTPLRKLLFAYFRCQSEQDKPKLNAALEFEAICFESEIDSFTGKNIVNDLLNVIRAQMGQQPVKTPVLNLSDYPTAQANSDQQGSLFF